MANMNPSQNTPLLPNMRRIAMWPSGASCSRRNSAKLSLATISNPRVGLVGANRISGLSAFRIGLELAVSKWCARRDSSLRGLFVLLSLRFFQLFLFRFLHRDVDHFDRLLNLDEALDRRFGLAALVTGRDGLGPVVARLGENLARVHQIVEIVIGHWCSSLTSRRS